MGDPYGGPDPRWRIGAACISGFPLTSASFYPQQLTTGTSANRMARLASRSPAWHGR